MRADPWYGTIFLFLEQIAPSWRHISMHVLWFLAWMLSRCGIKYWELLDSLADFSQRWQEIRNQGSSMYFYALRLWKGEFSGSKISFISRCEWIISARVNFCECSVEKSYVRKLSTPGWYWVNLQVSQTIFNHNQNLFVIVSACLASLQKFLNGKSDS